MTDFTPRERLLALIHKAPYGTCKTCNENHYLNGGGVCGNCVEKEKRAAEGRSWV